MKQSAKGSEFLKEPPEIRYKEELETLAAQDKSARPPGWKLSPQAVKQFITGTQTPGSSKNTKLSKKFHGDSAFIDRAIVTLMSNRGLLLVGEPGTAKSMLSELLSAAISGTSMLTIQGTAGTTEDQIKYSWNYALLLADGPTPQALVPAPLYHGLIAGQIVRFEEITRCPPEVQDTMISVLSDKVLHIPELKNEASTVFAKQGFNIIATANTRDRGVHEMSAALKRRFNFETVLPIEDKDFELELVMAQANDLLHSVNAEAKLEKDVIDVLVTTFSDLRRGRTEEGAVVEKPSTAMSTAEAVSVAFAAGLEAAYLADGRLLGEHLAKQLVGTVLKDSDEDAKKIRQYFDVVVKQRAKRSEHWKSFYEGRGILAQ